MKLREESRLKYFHTREVKISTESYYTEQYVGSVLNQYQNNTSLNTNVKQNVDQSYEHLMQNKNWSQSEETKRRLLNESLFKSIDQNLYSRPSMTTTNVQKYINNSVMISNASEESVRKTSLNDGYNDSIYDNNMSRGLPQTVRQELVNKSWPQKSTSSAQTNRTPFESTFSTVSSIRSSYYGQSLPQTRNRPQTNAYKAKVIDYSKDPVSDTLKTNYQRMVSNATQRSGPLSTSVLTERNTGAKEMRANQRPNESLSLQSMPLTTSEQTVNNKMPKPILKRPALSISDHFTKLLTKPNREHEKLTAVNTTAIRMSYTGNNPKPKEQNILVLPSKQTQPNARFRDTLLSGYEKEGIIKTIDLDRNEIYYCYYCNNYIKKLITVEKHCKVNAHINSVLRGHNYQSGLNKNFVSGEIRLIEGQDKSTGLTLLRMELDRIPIHLKHYYYRKGIRLKELGGPHAYYCKFCDKPIQCLESIENHLFSESHCRIEDKPTFNKFLSQTTEPIIGLQYITEYLSPELTQPVYECQICKCFEDAYEMYLHVCSFKHRLNLLRQFNPNEVSLKFITETAQAAKEVTKRISDLLRTNGTGAIKKINNKPPNHRTTPTAGKGLNSRTESVEVIDIIDDDEPTNEKSQLEKQFAVKLTNEDQAADAAIAIQLLKEAVVKYYLDKIPIHMRKVLMNKVIEDFDNNQLSSMDTNL